MKCVLCGKRVNPTKSNFILLDGNKPAHKKCPSAHKSKLDPDRKILIDEVYNQFNTNAKGYIADSGFNHYKLLNQIKTLYEYGYSYQEQLYALKKVVEKQNGFYGYTSVVNQISRIIAQKRKRDELLESAQYSKHQEDTFDVSKFMDGGDYEW